jgi:hypothetical protein
MDVPAILTDLVRSLGFQVDEPVALRSTNNLVVWLAPSLVVAKVSADVAKAREELVVASELVELGAPVMPPIDVGGQPFASEAGAITLWRYAPQEDVQDPSSQAVAEQLLRLHVCFKALRPSGHVPLIDESASAAIDELDRSDHAPELSTIDRALLRRTLVRGRDALAAATQRRQLIHGSPHRFNVVVVDGDPRFIDFETVARGPREWDLAHLEPAVADIYADRIDRDLLAACRLTVSAATATWCWGGLERGQDMRDHATNQLELVRAGPR